MKKGILIAALIATGSWTSASVKATELVYEPINPSFGGNPLNGSFLLSKANSQNAHTAPYSERSYDERLQESLERAYINRIVREITDIAFGEQEYDEDGNPIDSIVVNITNLLTGEVTVVEIPRFG
ncbi:curli assembly protein CsgF [Alteromonas macleodii]